MSTEGDDTQLFSGKVISASETCGGNREAVLGRVSTQQVYT